MANHALDTHLVGRGAGTGVTLNVNAPSAATSTQIWVSPNGSVSTSQQITVTSSTLNQTRTLCVRPSGALTDGAC